MNNVSFLQSVLLIFVVCSSTNTFAAAEKSLNLSSPNEKIELRFSLSAKGIPSYQVHYQEKAVLADSTLGLSLKEGPSLESNFEVLESTTNSHDESWKPFTGERAAIRDHYNELTVKLRTLSKPVAQLNLNFRVYDEGTAVCYTIPKQAEINDFEITEEKTEFCFTGDHLSWSSKKVEGQYSHLKLSELEGVRGRPMLVEVAEGPVVAMGEARMVDYARMQFELDAKQEHTILPSLDGTVKGTAPFTTPWRYLMMADSASELIEKNDLVPNLNDPCAIEDTSWIRPGKVFRSELSTEAAKACVDVGSKLNFQHLLLDAGWYGNEFSNSSDATTVTVDPKRYAGPLDMQEVIDYAASKDMGVILYVNRRALEKQLDDLLPLFNEWGIAGIKFGFVNVGPQKWTQWVHEAVRKCADHKLVVDIHDHYLPTGYSRTYPNLLTQEGIHGNEQMPTPEHNVTLPFIRFLCGPGDYTVCYYSGRIQTTRAHQLAASIVYYSPIQLLFWYDRPATYKGEPELNVFKELVTTWDDTKVIQGEIGSFITIARRTGDKWMVGSMNAEEQRTLQIPLTFLDEGVEYEATTYSDEDPTGDAPKKVALSTTKVTSQSILSAKMAHNGGQAIVIKPVE